MDRFCLLSGYLRITNFRIINMGILLKIHSLRAELSFYLTSVYLKYKSKPIYSTKNV